MKKKTELTIYPIGREKDQKTIIMPKANRASYVSRIIKEHNIQKAIVFVNDKRSILTNSNLKRAPHHIDIIELSDLDNPLRYVGLFQINDVLNARAKSFQ